MRHAESGSLVEQLSVRQAALMTGLAYLLNPVTFAEMYAMPHLVSANPAQTVANITAHPHLFSAAILSYVFSALGDVVIAWGLYVMLSPVNRSLALLGSSLQLMYAAIWLSAISHLGVLYRLVAIPDYSRHIGAADLPVQAVLLLGAFRSAWGIALILFGLHLVVTGWLMARSTYLPHWLGWLLFLDGWAWVVDQLSIYLFPQATLGFLQVVFVIELVFMVWLLGWGWRLREPSLVRTAE